MFDSEFALQNFSGLCKQYEDGNKLSAHLQPDDRLQPPSSFLLPRTPAEQIEAAPHPCPPRRPRLKPSPPSSGSPPLVHASASNQFTPRLAKRWWTRGGLCWARRSRLWWRVSLSASSAAATRSSASRRRAGGRRAPTRSSSASACAPPSVCSRRWGPSPRTPYRRPASPSAASLNSTPAPTPARAPSASTSTRCPTGTTSASRGARASASNSPQPSCNGHLATVRHSLGTTSQVLICFYPYHG